MAWNSYSYVGEERFEKHGFKKHVSYAFRWSQSIGNWDIGLSHFYGTSRDPSFLVKAKKDGRISHNSLL